MVAPASVSTPPELFKLAVSVSCRFEPLLFEFEQIGASASQLPKHSFGVFLCLTWSGRLFLEVGDSDVNLAQFTLDLFERVEAGMHGAEPFVLARSACRRWRCVHMAKGEG